MATPARQHGRSMHMMHHTRSVWKGMCVCVVQVGYQHSFSLSSITKRVAEALHGVQKPSEVAKCENLGD